MAKLQEMTNLISHRGPDDEGFAFICSTERRMEFRGGPDTPEACYDSPYSYAPVRGLPIYQETGADIGFGHRRLSILDLSPAGHQPMVSHDGRFVIVFNGEIYNYLELRKELEEAGFSFLTRCDTEVILYAYAHWGSGCLARFNGMFAFLLYDLHTGRLMGARDRYGVKPLYYWYSPDHRYLSFASEIKQFTVLPGWTPRINGTTAYEFLVYGLSDHSDATMFESVWQLKGGEYFAASVQELRHGVPVQRWYEGPSGESQLALPDAVAALKGHITNAVGLRLRSDVPFGYSISGGLDSSTIVCFASQLQEQNGSHYPQKSFFCTCDGLSHLDERGYAAAAAKAANVELLTANTSYSELISILDTMIWHMDEPFKTTSAYAEWSVYRLMAQNNIIVSLNGHGADELMGGYLSFAYIYLVNLLTSLKFREFYKNYVSIITANGLGQPYSFYKMVQLYLPNKVNWFISNIVQLNSLYPKWINVKKLNTEHHYPDAIARDIDIDFKRVCMNELLISNLPPQLHWADRSSMAHSHESRHPFLDYNIVDFFGNLPVSYLIGEGYTKRILRLAIQGVVPEIIRLRKTKLGFVTPEEHWIKNQAPDAFMAMIEEAVDGSNGIFTSDLIRIAQKILKGSLSYSGLLWRVVAFSRWQKVFNIAQLS